MYANYWGLAETPFRNTVDARWFFASAEHEEALARLMFLVEEGRRCGVLAGPSGTGKSLVLWLLRGEARRIRAEVALVDLVGRSGREMLWETVSALGLSPIGNDSPFKLWRTIQGHILANRYARAPLVLMYDHFDRAHADCIAAVERLHHFSSDGDTGLTLILGVGSERLPALARTLRTMSDLRIELNPFDRYQTQEYVETVLSRAGAAREVFEPGAFDRLFEETRGIPRELNRLCDVALLAGMAEDATQISESIVSAAAEELHLKIPAERSPMFDFSQRHRFASEI
jgi:general secretion pathway protein A